MEKTTVLLVDDDITLGNILAISLQKLGCEVIYLPTYADIIGLINQFQPEVIVLDIEVGEYDCFTEARQIHGLFPQIPIIFISAHTELNYIKSALEAGGINFLKKPFDTNELALYIKRYAQKYDETVGFGSFTLNCKSRELKSIRKATTERLSEKESRVLSALAKRIGYTLSRQDIEKSAWGEDNASDQTINNVIARLRKSISNDPSVEIISETKIGYKLTDKKKVRGRKPKLAPII